MDTDAHGSEMDLTEGVIGAAFEVAHALGAGFLEKVYENALAIELRKNGLKVEQQHPIKVFYDNQPVGDFSADLLIEDSVLVELKAARILDDVHAAQCLNYLKATGLKVCLLVNFGRPRVEIKRLVL